MSNLNRRNADQKPREISSDRQKAPNKNPVPLGVNAPGKLGQMTPDEIYASAVEHGKALSKIFNS